MLSGQYGTDQWGGTRLPPRALRELHGQLQALTFPIVYTGCAPQVPSDTAGPKLYLFMTVLTRSHRTLTLLYTHLPGTTSLCQDHGQGREGILQATHWWLRVEGGTQLGDQRSPRSVVLVTPRHAAHHRSSCTCPQVYGHPTPVNSQDTNLARPPTSEVPSNYVNSVSKLLPSSNFLTAHTHTHILWRQSSALMCPVHIL